MNPKATPIEKRAVVFDLNMRQPYTVVIEPTEPGLINEVCTTLGIHWARFGIKWDRDDRLVQGGEFWSAGIRLGRFDIK